MNISGNKVGNRVNLLIDGTILSKDCGTDEAAKLLFKHMLETKANPTQDNIDKLYEFLNQNIRIAKAGGFEFDIESGITYLKGFNTPVPQDLLEIIEDYIENGYPTEPIINFWKLLMANPDKRVREDLFKFISEHDFSLTDKGYLVVYKTVDYMNKVEKDLAELVSNSYIKIISSWKKSPAKFTVYEEITRTLVGNYEEVLVEEYYNELDDEEEFFDANGYYPEYTEDKYVEKWVEREEVQSVYKVTETETVERWIEGNTKEIKVLGTLEEMQSKLDKIEEDKKSVYTDKYTHSMEIRLGEPVYMPRTNCNADPRYSCSNGLHVGATKYVENFINAYRKNSDLNESPVLVCLVNPMKVVAVPKHDSSKMRVSEYYPFARGTVDCTNGNKIEIIEQKYFENDYANIEESELLKLIEASKDEDTIRPTAMNAEADDRDIEEYRKMLEMRVFDLKN